SSGAGRSDGVIGVLGHCCELPWQWRRKNLEIQSPVPCAALMPVAPQDTAVATPVVPSPVIPAHGIRSQFPDGAVPDFLGCFSFPSVVAIRSSKLCHRLTCLSSS